jgi:protein tyrosine/serine phosphatase
VFCGDLASGRGQARAWIDSLFLDHGLFRAVWDNLAPVIPGRLYRSNHPTPGRLARAVERYGLRSVMNLRGERQCGSDALSREAARRLGLTHIYMPFESRGAPHRDRILHFHDIYRALETPALMHCKAGADRAGLAAGLVIMFEGGTTAQALRQLSLRFGHFSHSSTGVLDAFFIHYATVAEGRKRFLDWVHEDYDETALRANFTSDGLSSFINDWLLARE